MAHRKVSARTRGFAAEQRRTPTRAEEIVWRELRGRRLGGLKFRRQAPIGPYVADFACYEARLVVELDGAPHEDDARRAYDARRDAWLRQQGFRVVLFPNEIVLGGTGDLVLDAIRRVMDALPSSDLR